MADNLREEGAGHTSGREPGSEQELRLLHELMEALTATGNYLAAANHILAAKRPPARRNLGEALEKIINQFQRANDAARKLRDLIHPDTPDNESRTK